MGGNVEWVTDVKKLKIVSDTPRMSPGSHQEETTQPSPWGSTVSLAHHGELLAQDKLPKRLVNAAGLPFPS